MVYEEKEKVYKSWWPTFGSGESLAEDTMPDTNTKVDAALLHDIAPQPGGDHEPFDCSKTLNKKSHRFSLKFRASGNSDINIDENV